jgi:hypothetical protein
MIAGHFGLAAGAKAGRPDLPLWTLMLATVWLDVVFAPLLATGVEWIETAPDGHGNYGSALIHADYTHSLVGALVLSAIYGLLFLRRFGRTSALVLGAVAFSHWVLDLVVHRADLPLLPGDLGGLPHLGMGLWRVPWLAAAVETVLIVGGAALYYRAARQATARAGRRERRPMVLAALVVASGLGTLALNWISA